MEITIIDKYNYILVDVLSLIRTTYMECGPANYETTLTSRARKTYTVRTGIFSSFFSAIDYLKEKALFDVVFLLHDIDDPIFEMRLTNLHEQLGIKKQLNNFKKMFTSYQNIVEYLLLLEYTFPIFSVAKNDKMDTDILKESERTLLISERTLLISDSGMFIKEGICDFVYMDKMILKPDIAFQFSILKQSLTKEASMSDENLIDYLHKKHNIDDTELFDMSRMKHIHSIYTNDIKIIESNKYEARSNKKSRIIQSALNITKEV